MPTSLRIVTEIVLAPFSLVLILASSSLAADANWPQFRGADSRGIGASDELPTHWSATENVAWKADIPGRGWSSPIIWGDRVFLTTVINEGEAEEPRKGLYFGGDRPKPPDSIHRWVIYCLDLKTGRVLWRDEVRKSKPASSIHLKNSFASETPVTDGKRLYCYFGNVGVFCHDLEGKPQWKVDIEPRKTRFGWGTAASPVLHGERLYIINDNEQQSRLTALDKISGKEVWSVKRDEKSNWSTPFIWKNKLRTEIVTPGTGKIRSYGLDGKLLWSLRRMSSITIATPFEHQGLLYVSSGYVNSKDKPIYAIRPGGEGDISLTGDETSNRWIVWRNNHGPYNPTTLLYQDRLYVLYDFGLLACFNPRDGSAIFSKKRIPRGRAFTSSPWAYGGKVFCLNEDGNTFVFNASDRFEPQHVNKLAEDDMCMATPAIAGDRLLIRTSARVYCIQKSGAE